MLTCFIVGFIAEIIAALTLPRDGDRLTWAGPLLIIPVVMLGLGMLLGNLALGALGLGALFSAFPAFVAFMLGD